MRRRRPYSSPVLAVCLLAASLAGSVRCTVQPTPPTVTVWASWSGDEEIAFRQVLGKFTQESGIHYNYTHTRALNDVLLSAVQRGTQPDVAVSGQGDLATYQKRALLYPIDKVIGSEVANYDRPWLLPLPTPESPDLYAVPVKADLKSIVWFDPRGFLDAASPPKTWSHLTIAAAAKVAAQGGAAWCMGNEDVPNSGWPAADWIQDAILRKSGPDVYKQWAGGKLPWTSMAVTNAWTFLGDLVAHTVLGGTSGALFTHVNVAGSPMFANPRGCYLEHQGSFVMGFYHKTNPELKPGIDYDFFPLPDFGPGGDPAHLVAQPNLAAMFRNTWAARKLMKFLASAEAQSIWPHHGGGAFSMNKSVDSKKYPDGVSRRIAQELTTSGLCFEARNAMPPIMRDAFQRAVLEYLSDPDPQRLDVILAELESLRIALKNEPWPARDFSCTSPRSANP